MSDKAMVDDLIKEARYWVIEDQAAHYEDDPSSEEADLITRLADALAAAEQHWKEVYFAAIKETENKGMPDHKYPKLVHRQLSDFIRGANAGWQNACDDIARRIAEGE